jgi:hypothetical protein
MHEMAALIKLYPKPVFVDDIATNYKHHHAQQYYQ